jgi:hypothetical protein
LGEFGSLNDDVAHTAHRSLKVAYFVKECRLSRLMHLVDGVVHHRDQIPDVAPRSNGVMKVRLTASKTSRVITSASFS